MKTFDEAKLLARIGGAIVVIPALALVAGLQWAAVAGWFWVRAAGEWAARLYRDGGER